MVRETVLYYNPQKTSHAAKLKSVFVRMGIRIKNISTDQLDETVGCLLGIDGFEPSGRKDRAEAVNEEVLVLKNFSDSRIDELLMQLRKAGVPRIALKAVVTEHNVGWTFRELYEEIKKEHEQMSGKNDN